jgi:hypothetical protein
LRPDRATYRPPSDHASPTINATRLDFNKDLTNIRHQTTSRPSIDLLWQAATETPSTPTMPHSRPRPGLQTRRNIMTTLTPPSVVCQTDGTRTLPSRQLRLPDSHSVPFQFQAENQLYQSCSATTPHRMRRRSRGCVCRLHLTFVSC